MRFLLLLFALLLPAAAHAQLCGAYTIDGTQATGGTNYRSFDDAAAVLNTLGVSCATTFDVAPGTYDDSFTLTAIAGVSASNTVTFRADDPNNRPLLISTGATPVLNWVVRLLGADYVTFRNLDFEAVQATFGRIFLFGTGSDHNTVRGCNLTGVVGGGNDDSSLVYELNNAENNDNLFEDNLFEFGYIGLDFYDIVPYSDRTVVRGNVFSAQTEGGAWVQGDDALVDGNSVNAWIGSTVTYTGIKVWSVGAEITGNTVDMQTGGYGLWLGSVSATPRLLANNLVSLRGSAGLAAIHLEYGDVNVYHNTARVSDAAVTASALYVNDISAVDDVTLMNNVLVDDSGGFALRAPGGQIEASDHNDLYTSVGGLYLGFDGLGYSTLSSYQSATGLDAHSIAKAVTFLDVAGTPDLHLNFLSLTDVDLIGSPVGVLTDVDGDVRDPYNPKMGADEGTPRPPLDNADTAAGFYNVGGLFPDLLSPQVAFDQLAARGMKGAVTFRIRAGTFPLHRSLGQGVRVGPAATDPASTPFTVRAADANDRPTLQHAATDASNNHLLRLNGLDYVVLERLNLEATGTGLFGRLLVLDNGVEHLTVDDCTLAGLTSVDTDDASLVFASASKDQFNTFTNSVFTDGARGIDLGGLSVADPSDGNVVTGSTFANQYGHGIRLQQQRNSVVTDNFARTGLNSGGYVGIFAAGPGLALERNKVNASLSGTRGIHIGVGNDAGNRRRVVNNAVLMTGDGVESGIYLADNDYVDVYHNTVLVDGTFGLTEPTGLRIEAGAAGIDLRNNLLVNRGEGTAYVIEDDAAITRSDYNNLRSNGATLAVWDGTDYPTLADLRVAAAPDELHATAEAITFADPASDLHLAGASVGNDALAGEPLASVTDDVDGQARSATAPYRGADEAATPLTVANFVLAATNTTPLSVAPGGSIAFSYAVTNHTGAAATGDLYFTATGGINGLIRSGTIAAGQTVTASFTQGVAGSTAPGTYTYTLKIGVFPNSAVDEVPFQITVTPAPRQPGATDEWTVRDATPWVPVEEAVRPAVTAPETAVPPPASTTLPAAFALHAAAPNPFASRTTLRFDVPQVSAVTVEVLDLLGRRVAVLTDGEVEAGTHTVPFEASALPSGVYLVRMQAGAFGAVQRVTLVR